MSMFDDSAWLSAHRRSEVFAGQAQQALVRGQDEQAVHHFLQAARAETEALRSLAGDSPRLLGIISVSAAALLIKAHEPVEAQELIEQLLKNPDLPEFAAEELADLLEGLQLGPGHGGHQGFGNSGP